MKALFLIVSLLMQINSTTFAQLQCQNSCSSECIHMAQDILNTCGSHNPAPAPAPSPMGRVSLYYSDSCDQRDWVASLKPNTDCNSESLKTAKRTWAISIGNTCYNVTDVDSDKACMLYKAGSNPYSISLYNSDSCEPKELIAFVDENTNCDSLQKLSSSRVWGIVIDGQCRDISDTDIKSACERYKGR